MLVHYHLIINFILLVGKKKTAKPPADPDTVKTVISDSSRTVVDFLSQQSPTNYFIFFIALLVIAAILFLPRILDQQKINRLIKIGLWILSIILIGVALSLLPKNLFLIVCSAGILTIVIALFDLIRNLVARIIISYRSPFKKGDMISIDGLKGKVAAINLCLTHLQTSTNSVITIPNFRFLKISVENHSNGSIHFQVPIKLYLPLETDLIKAREIAQAAVKVSRYINLDHPLEVTTKNVLQSGRSVICLTLYAYINDPIFESLFRSEVTESIICELKKHNFLKAIQPTPQ
jgi:small-conductance mechanosensitive channel